MNVRWSCRVVNVAGHDVGIYGPASLAEEVVAGQWHPIDTAQHDGTPLVLELRAPIEINGTQIHVVAGWYVDAEWRTVVLFDHTSNGATVAQVIAVTPLRWMPYPQQEPT